MANAGGRLSGAVLCGLVFQVWGLIACLWGFAAVLVIAGLLSLALPSIGVGSSVAAKPE
jgi:hypothetical protein